MTIDPQIEQTWKERLKQEFEKDYFKHLKAFLLDEKSKGMKIYPKGTDMFNAFKYTHFENVKVVILGQDPYHGYNQAHGLAFSVQKGVDIPPSLRNIYQELNSDLGVKIPNHGNLEDWAKSGVFLLNTVLSVRAGEAHSHQKQGWENFTDAVIRTISEQKEHVVFILWGKPAQSKSSLIDTNKHLIIKSSHPSPLSAYRGFLGSRPFSRTNEYLVAHGITPVNWELV